MKTYSAKSIRNIVVAGHGDKGKTSLCEAMLFLAKATDRLGKVLDGNTVMDFDAEEKKRKVSISTAVAALEWKNTKVNLIDTPGLFDFAGGVSEGMRAADCAILLTSAGSGIDVGFEKAYKAAKNAGMAKIIAVTKCNSDTRNFYKTYQALTAEYGAQICPAVIPYYENETVKCYVDFINNKAYEYNGESKKECAIPEDSHISDLKDIFLEAVASSDDDLMEKFFGGEEFTPDEIKRGLNASVKDGSVIPVFACAGMTLEGIDNLLDALVDFAPSAEEAAGEGDIKCDENGPLAAICFKTVADPFVGKMSFFKVIRGKITPDTPAYNFRKGEAERMGKIITPRGGKQEETACIPAGDIGVVAKLGTFKTGDTMCSQKDPVELKGIEFPAPCLSRAVKVKKKGEEEKVAAGLNKIMEEDQTVSFKVDNETKEQVLSGLGEQHLDVIISKLNKLGVDVDLTVPRVAYRETIRKKVEVQGRHKKQSGGHGQFGDVYIRFEPIEGEDFVFAEEIVGGSVPKNYFPAVEKGLRECVAKGAIAGYPMVGIKATLYFGSYHPVDSSEMAFKTAAAIAFKNGIPQAQPTILEPIGTLKAYVPDDKMGDIMGDITKRRGRVLGMGPANEPKMQELVAEVPMAEMGDFSTVLRSTTAGRGYFSLEFTRYEDAPAMVAQKVIDEANAEKEE